MLPTDMVRKPDAAAAEQPDRRALVLSPHSDDAAFSLASTIGRLSAAGVATAVWTIFSQSAVRAGKPPGDPSVVGRLRRDEDLAFGRLFAGTVLFGWLDYRDAPLRGHSYRAIFAGERLGDADGTLSSALYDLLSPWLDSRTLVFAPAGVGRHIDHRIVRDCALRLFRDGTRPGALFLYEDLPYSGSCDLSEIDTHMRELAGSERVQLSPALVCGHRSIPSKEEAANCYPSQLTREGLRLISVHGHRLRRNGLTAERLWRVRTPGCGQLQVAGMEDLLGG